MDYSYEEKKLAQQLPRTLIGTGLGIISLGFVILFIIAYLLKYSDKIIGSITLTTQQMPLDHVAKTEGTLTLLVDNESVVALNQRIAYVGDVDSYDDVAQIETVLATQKPLLEKAEKIISRSNWKVEHLSKNLLQIEDAIDQYDNFLRADQQAALIQKKQKSIDLYKKRLLLLDEKSVLSNQDIQLAEKQSESKKRLAGEDIIAEAEFERAVQEKISKKFAQLDNKEAANAIQIYIAELEQEILLIRSDYEEQLENYEDKIKREMSGLEKAIQAWKDQYLIYANRAGQCSWSEYFTNGQYVQQGQKIGSIFPTNTEAQVGKMEIAMNGASKVKIGQEVNILLANYPASEFGILKGTINKIAPLPENGLLKIEVALPEKLISTYGVDFKFQQLATGQGEIITNKMSFAERIWNEAKGIRLNE